VEKNIRVLCLLTAGAPWARAHWTGGGWCTESPAAGESLRTGTAIRSCRGPGAASPRTPSEPTSCTASPRSLLYAPRRPSPKCKAMECKACCSLGAELRYWRRRSRTPIVMNERKNDELHNVGKTAGNYIPTLETLRAGTDGIWGRWNILKCFSVNFSWKTSGIDI